MFSVRMIGEVKPSFNLSIKSNVISLHQFKQFFFQDGARRHLFNGTFRPLGVLRTYTIVHTVLQLVTQQSWKDPTKLPGHCIAHTGYRNTGIIQKFYPFAETQISSTMLPKDSLLNLSLSRKRQQVFGDAISPKRRKSLLPMEQLKQFAATRKNNALPGKKSVGFNFTLNRVYYRHLTEEDLSRAWMSTEESNVIKKNILNIAQI